MTSPLLEATDDWTRDAKRAATCKGGGGRGAPPAAVVIGGKTSGHKKSDIGTFSYREMISDGPSQYVVRRLQYGLRSPPHNDIKVNLRIILL